MPVSEDATKAAVITTIAKAMSEIHDRNIERYRAALLRQRLNEDRRIVDAALKRKSPE